MRVFFNSIVMRIKGLNISTKIILLYSFMLVVSVTFSNSLYNELYSGVVSKKVSEVSYQTLSSVNSNFNSIFENINNYYLMLLSNMDLQDALKSENIDANTDRKIQNILLTFHPLIPEKSSIYVIDNKSNFYYYSRVAPRRPDFVRIQDVEWYSEIKSNREKFLAIYDAPGFSESPSTTKHISLIRGLADINSLSPIGTVVFDISTSYFENSLKSLTEKNNFDIAVFDQNNVDIIGFNNIKDVDVSWVLESLKTEEFKSDIKIINGHNYIISGMRSSRFDWKILSVIPFDEITKDKGSENFVALIVIMINSLFLFFGSLVISRMITTPIKKLLLSMKDVKQGKFKKVEINTGDNEFGKLIDGYNTMIFEIEKLIDGIIDAQRIKRKAELNVLQEQIKPHFLYNSFDSISSLILLDRNDEAYKLMEALKDYYKTSLSKGSEIITIEEEIGIVKNYLIIQKIRFGGKFDIKYDVDERVLDHKILKLVLQPLVENSIHHGIRQKRGKGNLLITAKMYNDHIRLIVEDDGIGIDEETLHNIQTNKSGFGLCATIERLRIFYGIEDILLIESSKDKGTIITIRIPLKNERLIK